MGTCVLRLLVSLTVGLVLLPRIDRTIMPKGHETKDLGGLRYSSAILRYTVLHYVMLNYAVLRYTMLLYAMLCLW